MQKCFHVSAEILLSHGADTFVNACCVYLLYSVNNGIVCRQETFLYVNILCLFPRPEFSGQFGNISKNSISIFQVFYAPDLSILRGVEIFIKVLAKVPSLTEPGVKFL